MPSQQEKKQQHLSSYLPPFSGCLLNFQQRKRRKRRNKNNQIINSFQSNFNICVYSPSFPTTSSSFSSLYPISKSSQFYSSYSSSFPLFSSSSSSLFLSSSTPSTTPSCRIHSFPILISFYINLIFLILLHISFSWSFPTHPKMSKNGNIIPEQQQNYLLSIDNVDKLFKRAAIFTMLKAKARASLSEVPQVERILFNQCLSEYKQEQLTPVIYAKCLVKLIKAKNRLKDAYPIPPQINQRRIQRFHHFYSIWRKRKGNKLIKLRKLNRRNKRSISTRTLFANKMDFELPKNIRNLRILERYGRTLKHCKRFISTMNERNAK
ncbi:unnamed protein product [Meloidogyne enterolobii]|uniref:Uncharacterized protein n=1 Tax=Meloidogyne enterolobii TaxID=390850 RepID=A0ACB0YPT5_MELEN